MVPGVGPGKETGHSESAQFILFRPLQGVRGLQVERCSCPRYRSSLRQIAGGSFFSWDCGCRCCCRSGWQRTRTCRPRASCISASRWLFSYMHEPPIRIYDLRDSRQYDHDREYWQRRSQEERLSAVEDLRRQYAMFPSGKGYESSERLRRVLRVVQ